MKVMVIDDDTTFLFIFRKQIEKFEGAKIVNESRNGAEAMSFLKKLDPENEEIPDLIALDLNMPIMDGWDFLDEYGMICRRGFIKAPVCILSSTINQSDFDRANTYEMVKSFFSKPITSDQLKLMSKISQIY
jgi:chemotaxis response regulator CheB